ncbi:hypothetical protein RRG08_015268 [Elysia crispata]|uniref:Uncharacterized protein n=1 Tax=Elysia crispata TaxID=231223 RepID=A0AAE1E408_9GAST|nr:hypothetical protein RRG08_015268 [Elysia crispata]
MLDFNTPGGSVVKPLGRRACFPLPRFPKGLLSNSSEPPTGSDRDSFEGGEALFKGIRRRGSFAWEDPRLNRGISHEQVRSAPVGIPLRGDPPEKVGGKVPLVVTFLAQDPPSGDAKVASPPSLIPALRGRIGGEGVQRTPAKANHIAPFDSRGQPFQGLRPFKVEDIPLRRRDCFGGLKRKNSSQLNIPDSFEPSEKVERLSLN